MRRRLCLAEAFCRDLSARAAAKRCKCSVLTAQKAYAAFRRLLLPWLEARYESRREEVLEYDEGLYLPAAKRRKRGAIFEAHNYLIFDYGSGVYTLLMPSLARYKEQFLADGMEDLYAREFSRFLRRSRVAKIERIDNTLDRFRYFVDRHMRRYKGIPPEQFILYLKEAEFKFNLPDIDERNRILRSLLLEPPSPAQQ